MTDAPLAVVYGELLLRLNPPGFQRLIQADTFEVRFTGAEANAGVSLVNFGVPTRVVSRVPDTDIGDACLRFLRRHGLDTSFVARGGDRLGLFYLETGASQRPSKVLYDRADTSIQAPTEADYDWSAIFKGATWFHFSGTAAALGPRAVAALDEALDRRCLSRPDRELRPQLSGAAVGGSIAGDGHGTTDGSRGRAGRERGGH